MPTNTSQDMPPAWIAPTGFPACLIFALACLSAVGQRDLVAFWRSLDSDDGWIRFHAHHRALLTPVMTVQGVIVATNLVFLTTSPPVPFADYTTPKAYFALSSAFVMSLAGVIFQLAFFSIGISHESPMLNLPEDELLNSQRGILTYLLSFRLPYLFVVFSLLFLTAGFMLAWPPTFAYLIGLILFCGSAIVLQRRCLPVDSWVAPAVAVLFVLIVLIYFFVISLGSMNI